MKRIVALLLFLAMQVPLMNQWGAVAYYRINRDYIAENLCVNRDKPMLNCNGQCYLAKKLKAAEEKEQKSSSERLQKTPEIVLSLPENSFSPKFSGVFNVDNSDQFALQLFYFQSIHLDHFRPPQFHLINLS